MKNLIANLANRTRNEDGQALAEYGLILGFIAALAVGALTVLGGAIGIPFADFIAGIGS